MSEDINCKKLWEDFKTKHPEDAQKIIKLQKLDGAELTPEQQKKIMEDAFSLQKKYPEGAVPEYCSDIISKTSSNIKIAGR